MSALSEFPTTPLYNIHTCAHMCNISAPTNHTRTSPNRAPGALRVSEALQMQSLALRYCAPQLSAPSSFSSPADGCVRSKIRMDACYRSYLLTIGNTEASTGPETAGRSTSAQQKWFMIRAQSHIFGTVLAI